MQRKAEGTQHAKGATLSGASQGNQAYISRILHPIPFNRRPRSLQDFVCLAGAARRGRTRQRAPDQHGETGYSRHYGWAGKVWNPDPSSLNHNSHLLTGARCTVHIAARAACIRSCGEGDKYLNGCIAYRVSWSPGACRLSRQKANTWLCCEVFGTSQGNWVCVLTDGDLPNFWEG